MPASPVPCPACGQATPVEPGQSARCPGCGLLVSAAARPRVRAADDVPTPRRGVGLAVVIGGALVVGAVAVAVFAYRERVRAERLARAEADRASFEAEMVQMVRVTQQRRAARELMAEWPLVLPPLPGDERLPPDEAAKRAGELGQKVIGVWRGPGVDGGTRVIEYRANGTFRDAVSGGPADRTWAGEWGVAGLSGTRVLRLTRAGGGPSLVRLTFEGGELVHDDVSGRATVLRQQVPAP